MCGAFFAAAEPRLLDIQNPFAVPNGQFLSDILDSDFQLQAAAAFISDTYVTVIQ